MSDQRYLVTARKYRPQRFEEIVAQQHVSETLKNAIRLDRLAHAYLFSGPRGVGKTTAARILAKAINCQTPLDQRGDGEPCRECDSCRTFEEGRSLSILEIDAASNNRVEDIRDLREKVLIPPQGSRKKVYIIDEVHMLSNAAFNALLKTLEEPPSHALFIFATTEPNKVLPTILSRCQRFDFRRIAVPEIVTHLETICRTETITADEASLMLIAHKGDGALRDALSAFDQAVSLCGANLEYQGLARAFGVVEVDLFFEVTQCVIDGKNAGLIALVDRIIREGYDLQEFLGGLALHLRHLLVARTMNDTSLIEAAEMVKQRYEAASQAFEEIDLLRLLMVVADGEDRLKTSMQPRLQLELILLKIASMPRAIDVQDAMNRLEDAERRLADQPTVAPTSAASQDSSPVSTPTPATGQDSSPPKPVSAPTPTELEPDPLYAAPPATNVPAEPEPAEHTARHEPEPAKKQPQASAPAESQDPPRTSYEGLFGTPALRKVNRPDDAARSSQGDTSAVVHDEGVLVAEMPSGAVDEIRGQWPAYLHEIKADRIHVSALLQHATPVEYRAQTLVLSVPDEFHKRMLSSQEEYLLEHLAQYTPESVQRMSYIVDLSGEHEQNIAESVNESDPREYMERKRQDNPIIKTIFEEFGGEMVW